MMRKVRRAAAAAATTAMLATVGVVTISPANAGILAEPAPGPVAYTLTETSLLVACRLATVDLTTGEVTELPDAAVADKCASDLAVAPDGGVWGVIDQGESAAALLQFDPTTGELLSSTEFTGNFSSARLIEGGLAFDAAGTLYVQLVTDEEGCDESAVCLYTADPATAVATFVGNPGDDNFETSMFTLAASCAGDMVTTEFSDEGANGAGLEGVDAAALPFRQLDFVDAATGIVTDGPALDDNFVLAGLDYDRVSGVLYALGTTGLLGSTETTSTSEAAPEDAEAQAQPDVQPQVFEAVLYTLDPSTGALTEVAAVTNPELNVETLGIAGACAPPEPAPIVLQPTFTG
jgi:hypothetical protein